MDPNRFGQGSRIMNLEEFQPLNGDFLFDALPVLPEAEMNDVLNNFNSQEFNDLDNHLLQRADSTSNDVDFHQQQSNKTATGYLPATDDYPGTHRFYIKMEEIEPNKNKWAYSSNLNKLYIRSERIIPIPFKWNPFEPGLVVRALPVFSDAQHMHKPVKRCYNHSNPSDGTNQGFLFVEHILRAENAGAVYEKNPASERCSVIVPLQDLQPGTSLSQVMYKFMCQTTCSGGMDRRPIMVLFTLERPNGDVLGRQKLNVKICSCPKRDMDKEEKNCQLQCVESKCNKCFKKETVSELEPPAKKIKKEVNETSTGHYLKLKFSNSKLFKSILKRVQEGLLRHSRDRNDMMSREASELLGEVDNQLSTLKK